MTGVQTCALPISKDVEQLIKKIEKAERVFFVGVGRVLLALEGMAKDRKSVV